MLLLRCIALFLFASPCLGSPSEVCRNTEERYYVADDAKCNRFHMCDAGKITTELHCEEGLYFDGSLQQCSTTRSHCTQPGEELKDSEQSLDQHSAGLAAHADAEALVLGREAQLAKGQTLDLTSVGLGTDAEALALGRAVQEVNRLRLLHAERLAAHAAAEAAVLKQAAELNARHARSTDLAAHADAEALVLGRQLQQANGQYLHSASPSLAAHADAEALVLGRQSQLARGQYLHPQSPSLAAHADAEALVLGRQAQLAKGQTLLHPASLATHADTEALALGRAAQFNAKVQQLQSSNLASHAAAVAAVRSQAAHLLLNGGVV